MKTFTTAQILANAGVTLTPMQQAAITAIIFNETTNNSSKAFGISPPLQDANSGYTIGPIQFDFFGNPKDANAAINTVMIAAGLSQTQIDAVNVGLTAYESSHQRLSALDPSVISTINAALATPAGQMP